MRLLKRQLHTKILIALAIGAVVVASTEGQLNAVPAQGQVAAPGETMKASAL